MNMMEARGILIQEATELLAGMESALLEIEDKGASAERINEIFRAAHTIKGSSGLFGFDLIVSFTHVMESLLVRVRNQEIDIDSTLTSLLLHCSDYVGRMIDGLAGNNELVDPDPQLRNTLLKNLKGYETANVNTIQEIVDHLDEKTPAALWNIRMRLAADILREGLDPVSFIYYLSGMGIIVSVNIDEDKLPALTDLDPEQCYLGFDIQLRARASQAELEQALEFILDGNDITVTPAVESTINNIASEKFSSPQVAVKNRNAAEQTLLKVDARKLDQLIDAVGELITRSASGRSLSVHSSTTSFHEFMSEIEQFVEQIRDRALNLRMAPVGEIFQRFPRVVRDVSKDLGKKIELMISGADTELDKSMIDKLGDPLMHIVRNAMDHGIESVAARIAAGKPELGLISLNAYHESGCVVIEIMDDGKGLDKTKIFAKACERGLIDATQNLSEQEIFMLIFEPGFSTAETVTDLSGRGVGMDVVRRNIEALRGTVELDSREGEGTQLRIRLPLTLSIIDGFQVAVSDSNFVIPMEMVVECVDMPELNETTSIVNLRGVPLPYIRLADEFAIDAVFNDVGIESTQNRQCMLVLQCGQQRAGVVVDRLVGELQAVIKPLSHFLRGIKGLSGSTILGDGTVALILDVAALMQRSKKAEMHLGK